MDAKLNKCILVFWAMLICLLGCGNYQRNISETGQSLSGEVVQLDNPNSPNNSNALENSGQGQINTTDPTVKEDVFVYPFNLNTLATPNLYYDPDTAFLNYDSDGDGIADVEDNCVGTPNESQLDINADSIGDLCEEDDETASEMDADGDV